MKKFLLSILLFLVLLVAGVIVLFLIPVDRKYAYDFLSKGGCKGRPPWIYQRIFEDTTNIDIAFIGTSHTMCAVNDEWMQKLIFDSTGKSISCRNLSFCGYGRDYDYVVIKDLIEHKKVKALVLEIREEEPQLGHLAFPYISSTQDLFKAPKYFNRSYLPAIYKAFIFRLQYLRELFTHEDIKHKTDISTSPFGFNGTNASADENELRKNMVRAQKREKNKISVIENALNAPSLFYVKKISKLAKSKQVKLFFLYLPAYSGQADRKEIEATYSSLGKIISPEEKVLQDKINWADNQHLNLRGAEKISQQLVSAVASI